MTTYNTPRLRHGLGFLLGFGFAFLPGYGPFFGLLFFLSTRWQVRRQDAWWLAAAVLCGLPLMLSPDTWWQGLLSSVQIIVAWLLYRAFGHLHGVRQALPALHERSMRWGLLAGLALVVSLGWWQIEALNLGAAKTIAQAIVWRSPPSLYGHAVLVLGALMAVLMPQAGLRVTSLGLTALGILVSGSREAAIAWVIVALALFVLHSGRSKRSFWLELSLLAVMFGVAIGLSPHLGWGRVGFLLDLAPSVESRQNLIQGSEIADGDWWDALGVSVSEREATLDGQTLTVYDIAKLEPESWRRLQQAVTLEPNQPYTLSAYVQSAPGARPSLQGWGRVDTPANQQRPHQNASTFIVIGEMLAGRWRASVSGPGRVLASSSAVIDEHWQRVWLSFVYTGDTPLTWWVGMAPDRREQADTASAFAGFQLEPTVSTQLIAPSPYRPGAASQGLGLQVARLPYWRAAWQGFLERPWFGQEQTFSHYFLTQGYSSKIQQPPSHVHNLFLQFLFTRGIFGLTGLLLFLAALIYPLVQRRDIGMLTVVGALLIANLFDYSLFYGAVLYPLVAVAGWRASQSPQMSLSRGQLGVSLYLSLLDLGAAYLTFALAHALMYGDGRLLIDWSTLALPQVVRYGFLLYPLLFWRNGLYPGYGLTAAQELRKQVSGSSYATLGLAVVRLAFQDGNNLNALTALLLMWLLGLLAYPVGRALSKRLLHLLGLWGRAVVILGAGTAGMRVAKALCKAPLDGLQPVAFFDDDPAKIGRVIQGLPVVGSLAYADVYASKRAIRHAIVAIPTAPASVMSSLVSRKGRVFTWLQFVPELPGLPAEDVYTGNLAGLLALEVRNGLYAQTSRVFKRSIDLLGAIVGGLLIAPLLLLLYLWVRVDSPGGAFHWSARIGESGKPFRCLKFRTMHLDAEDRLRELLEQDPALRAEYERYHKLEHDPRITPAGRILRKFSLDELSQLYNVIIGEMSLIGPRPYLARELDDMGEHAKTILLAKPGMTGYWQVSGRSNVSFGERLEMEAHYVRNWSIWWDIILLLQTVRVVLNRQGAH